MLSAERERLILESLSDHSVKRLEDIGTGLGVSEATVRRDLIALEERGLVLRVHGGALRTRFPQTEPLFVEKASFHPAQKSQIAELALEQIQNGDTIFLDGGSTVLSLAKMLEQKRSLIVVTNSLMAAAELMESSHKLILVGGEFRPLSRTLVGPLTGQIIQSLSVDKAFLGTIGFSAEEGISTTDPNEAYTKELIMKRSRKVYVLADSSKLGTLSFARSGSLSDIHAVITDKNAPEDFLKKLRKAKIEIIN
ncbi:MAG: hypothetical protein A2X49_02450 [Lentisphaerae bacterium GWF2_52_8]|nr:MAG: hypothetical protein A2X49_02450 [Lentisphaerae bacterium GWF2_52_8]